MDGETLLHRQIHPSWVQNDTISSQAFLTENNIKNYFILSQFLFEAVFLSFLGGLIGLILIYLLTLVSGNFIDMEKEYFVTGINSPNNQYLNIHDLLMPKDY